jgi:hypothetical protein
MILQMTLLATFIGFLPGLRTVVSSQDLGLAMGGSQGSPASQILAVARYTSAASESD